VFGWCSDGAAVGAPIAVHVDRAMETDGRPTEQRSYSFGVRSYLALLLLVAALSACGSSSGEARDGAPSAEQEHAAATARIESCVDRLLSRATTQDVNGDDARRYARDTYCARFEANGWIYDDGVLSIGAQTWLEQGGTCAFGSEEQPTRTVPCDALDAPGTRRLDCALLHHTRRSDVKAYVERLQRERPVIECDDGTPVDDLGVPDSRRPTR
jgi:hypothetical protein